MNRLELRAWRRTRYLTQTQLGELLKVNKMTVYRWESGQSDVPPFLDLALAHLDDLHSWSPDGAQRLHHIGKVAS